MADDDFFNEFNLGDAKPKEAAAPKAKAAASSSMPADVETRIRALPGNGTCADCSNISPQWASVTYGTLVCLECSGQHRSLGVHLSFVRSIQMDSWTEKQIMAMDKSGGNAKLVEYLQSKGIEQNMQVAKKYNTPQAAYFKERLSRWLEGKTEPPPDPGNYDPATGLGDAQGAEPLPGESTEEYNARQGRLRDQARERMAAKFGAGGMSGIGSGGEEQAFGGDGPDVGKAIGAAGGAAVDVTKKAAGAVGSVVTGSIGFLKSNVIENTDLHKGIKDTTSGALGSAKGAAGAVTDKASGLWSGFRKSVDDGSFTEKLKNNATGAEGSAVSKGFGWGMGAATSLWAKTSEVVGDVVAGNSKPCTGDHQLTVEPRSDTKCSLCNVSGTRYACGRGCEYYICPKCFEKPPAAKASKAGASGGEDDGGWGEWEEETNEPPPEVTEDDMARIAKELGMNIGGDSKPEAAAGGYVADAATAAPAAPQSDFAPLSEAEPKPKPKAKPADEVDFFADF